MPAIACSYDMTQALVNPLRVTTSTGECLFCEARCLAKWALQRATNPRLSVTERDHTYVLTRKGTPGVEFHGIRKLTAYAVQIALGPDA